MLRFLIVCALLHMCILAAAQVCPPPSFPNNASGCAQANFVCNLNGYCNTFPFDPSGSPFPGCPSNVLNNDAWFQFVANATTISITIDPKNCTGPPFGMQGGIYAACGNPNTGSGYSPLAVQCPCTTDPFTLTSSSFVVGQTYYIVFDGCAGRVCSYNISVSPSNATVAPPIPAPVQPVGPVTVCNTGSSSQTYSIANLNYATSYNWSIIPATAGTVSGTGTNATVSFTPGFSGTVQVCANGVNGCGDGPTSCRTITVSAPPTATISGGGSGCGTGSFPLTVDFTGAGPWTFIYAIDGVPQPPITTSSDPYTLNATTNGAYTLVSVSNPLGASCPGTVSGSAAISQQTVLAAASSTAATCSEPNGSASVTVAGTAPGPYTYVWSNTATTSSLTNITPGTYTVTVTAAGGCTATASVTVANNNLPITISGTSSNNTTCFGRNGEINVTINPAPPVSTYTWNTGATGLNLVDLSAGTYTITASLGGSCTATQSFTITNAPNRPTPALTPTGATCGQANGAVNLNVTGGVSPFTYAWSNASPNNNLTNIPSGTYTVTVTGANGCTNTASVTVTNTNVPIVVNGTVTPNSSCNSTSNGAINLSVTPAGTYTYTWLPSGSGTNLTNLTAGTYNVTVSAGGSCTGTGSFTVNNTPNPPTVTLTATGTTCFLDNGTITSTVTGGTPPYTYIWSDGTSTTPNLVNIPPDPWTVTVTDALGCTATASITPPNTNPPINVTGVVTANTSCGATPNGAITVTITPPNPNYTFEWSNGSTNQNLTGLPPGTYTITVYGDGACSEEVTFTVPANPNSPTVSVTPVGSTCDLGNGSISATASGGSAPYTYAWAPAGSGPNLNNQTAGTYTVTVTDANNCTATATGTIANTNPPLSVTGVVTNNTACGAAAANGGIDISVSPSGTYTYSWTPASTNQDLTNIPAGTYVVTVTGAGSCTGSASFTVVNNPNSPTVTLTPVNTTCNLPNGSITATANGGIAPYTYTWAPAGSGANPTNVIAGTYTVTVTSANNCTATASTSVTNSNPPINVTGNVTPNTVCTPPNNGAINTTVTPAGTYTYSWNPTSATTPNLTGLNGGTYSVTVTGAGTCTGTGSFTVPNLPNNPSGIATPTPANCGATDGTITLSPSGGQAPYTYLWSNNATTQNLTNLSPGTYTVTITSANGCTGTASATVSDQTTPISVTGTTVPNSSCTGGNGSVSITVSPANPNYAINWSTGSNSTTLTNLASGNYTVTVTLGVTCSQTASFTVTSSSNIPNVTPQIDGTTCGLANGNITITPGTGPTPYTYAWSNSSSASSLANIPAGNYSLTVTGNNGCSAVYNYSVTNTNPTISAVGSTSPNSGCANPNGSVTLVSVTPAGSYTFTWSSGQNTQNITGVGSGIYTVTITGQGTCSATASFNVGSSPVLPQVSYTTVSPQCGQTNGSITVTPVGGNSPFTYAWSGTTSTSNMPQNLGSGTYSVTLTDGSGCTATQTIQLQNANVNISIIENVEDNTSCSSPNGYILLTVFPVGSTVQWSHTSSTNLLQSGLSAGTYTVTVTTSGGCTLTKSFQVFSSSTLPTVSAVVNSQATCGASNGSILASASGGSTPYTYTWSNGANTPTLSNLGAGTYSVTVTTQDGCSATAQATIVSSNTNINITGAVTPLSNCSVPNGGITLTVSPPSANYTYLWAPGGQNIGNINGLTAGTYTVTVSQGPNCSATRTFTVADNTSSPNLSANTTPASCGLVNGSINLTVTGGAAPLTFAWSNGATTEDLNGIASGNYTVSVTASNGCTSQSTFAVGANNPTLTINGTPQNNTSCATPNGSIAVAVTPTGSYTYAWNTGATTTSLSGQSAGLYTVTVSAGGNCSASATFQIGNTTVAPTITSSIVAAICGDPIGAINLTVTGSNAPFTYQWSSTALPGGSTNEDLTGIAAGLYQVTVTDATGCTAVDNLTVPNNASTFSISEVTTNYTSCTSPNGAIDVTVTPPGTYTYAWSDGSTTTQDRTGIAAGTYTVSVTQSGACTATLTVIVEDRRTSPVVSLTTTPDVCGTNSGSVTPTVLNAAQPLVYAWSNNSNLPALTNVPAGSYTLTVTDANQCTAIAGQAVNAQTFNFNIVGNANPNASCAAPNGTVTLTLNPPSPPTGTYGFSWSNGASSQNLTGLNSGTYVVTVSTVGTCTNTASFAVGNQSGAPDVNGSVQDALCGGATGAINVNVSSGQSPYTYLWTNGATTQNLSNIGPGNYGVTVTDANNCAATGSWQVDNQVVLPTINTASTPNSSCAQPNGSATATATIAQSGLTLAYTWSNNASSAAISNLNSGTYTVTVSAGAGCSATATATVGNTSGAPDITGTTTQASCGQANGSVNITVTNQTPPVAYNWTNGATTEDLQGVTAGTYTVTVTIGNGCSNTASFTVGTSNQSFTLSASSTPNTSCAAPNGSASVTVSPAGTYAYAWSNNASSATISNLNSGIYTVTVSAGGSCSVTATATVANQAGAPTLSATTTAAICSSPSGGINLNVSGGQQPYSYAWSSGATTPNPNGLAPGIYTVTVTDGVNCTSTGTYQVSSGTIAISIVPSTTPSTSCAAPNGAINVTVSPAAPAGLSYGYTWSTGINTQTQANLPAGTYTVTVSAGVGCSATATATVQSQLALPTLTAAPSPAICGNNAGAIDLTVSAGTSPYTYTWSNSSTAQDLSGIAAGTYTVTVTDSNGCQSTGSYTVTNNTFTPTVTAATQPNNSCANPNGSATISISPTANYTIAWSSGSTSLTTSGLVGGSYQVTVSAGGTCSTVQTVNIPDASGAPTIAANITNVLCFGQNTGAINLTVSGGQAPYQFVWNPPSAGTGTQISNLNVGNYAVTVTDGLGCSSIGAYSITGPSSAVTLNCFQAQQVSGPGATDGIGRVNVSGGRAPYVIVVSPGAATGTTFAGGDYNIPNLAEGVYNVTVTDANNCSTTCSFTIGLQGCTTNTGTLQTAAASVCGQGCITLTYNQTGQVLDPNDILQFILYSGANPLSGTILSRSNTPVFCFNPANMQLGQQYFVAVAAGNDVGGNVNLSDFCTVISAGTPVEWKRTPIASVVSPAPLNCEVRTTSLVGSSSVPLSSFAWSTLNGTIVGVPSAAVIQATKAGNYRLIVSANGCADTTNTIVTDISNAPIAKITAAPGDLLDCRIDSIQLSGTIEGTLTPIFVWLVNGLPFSNGAVVTVDNPGVYAFVVVDTVTRCSDTTEITIKTDNNFPLLEVQPPDTLTCAKGSVQLSGRSPFAGITFRWGRLVGADTIFISNTATATATITGTYIFVGFDPMNNCLNSVTVDVPGDISAPTADAGLDQLIDCFGDTVMLDGSASLGKGVLQYQWTTTNGNIITGANTVAPLIGSFGTYRLVVTQSANGCTDADLVDVAPLPITGTPQVISPRCEGQRGSIQVSNATGLPPISYRLNGGATNTTGVFTQLPPGSYTIQMTDAQGCVGVVTGTVTQAAPLTLSLPAIVRVQLGDRVQLNPVLNIPASSLALISWTPTTSLSCGNCLNPFVDSLYQTTLYRLFVRDSTGCEQAASVRVQVDKQLLVEVPNVFNPTEQGNDKFYPFAYEPTIKQIDVMRVYDRWGEQVFEQFAFPPNNPTYGWDGRLRDQPLNPAVFVWYLEVTFIDGTKRQYAGDVTLIR